MVSTGTAWAATLGWARPRGESFRAQRAAIIARATQIVSGQTVTAPPTAPAKTTPAKAAVKVVVQAAAKVAGRLVVDGQMGTATI